jgi:WxL domain surface cell wall-binding
MRAPSTASALLALILALCLQAPDRADATIYYRTSTSTENGAGSTSIVMTVPSGVAVGDLLVASVNASGTTAFTAPTGWTSLIAGASTGYYGTEAYRVATAADAAGASYTWSLGATARKATGSMLSYVGVDTTTIGTPSATLGSSTTLTFNSVTTAVANSRVILSGSGFNSTSAFTLTPPGTATTRLNFGTSSTGSQVRSYTGDFLQATAGATGTKTATLSPSSAWASVAFAVRPGTGTLAFEVAPDVGALPDVTLNGQAQTTTAQMNNFTVDDTTGSGSGWNVTVAGDASAGKSAVLEQYCTQAGGCGTDAFGYVSGGQTLPAGSLKLDTTGASFTGANGTAPTFQCSSACSVDAGAATKVASAAAGAGQGPWRSTGFSSGSLSLSTATTMHALPANEIYRADLLWTLSSGP